ncbi:competence/damage-inducible protein A [Terriglobus aquaticus]|uniref:CinA-like protein n=1 Tax=Terriglobus aquaticus TaxID=940139 RepID=A0ABW9KMR8_9BACT|nr:competence/damage-inducible protein A [Terriglobus aquaticus]
MIAEIIAVGSEMLTPYRVDTNSLALTAELNKLGVAVAFKTILGDDLQQLTDAARIALRRADIVLFSGGLGPTEDDLTREAVAAVLGVGMTRDASIIESLRERFRKRGIEIRENNLKQADVIDGAEVLPNANGTAPGQWIDTTFEDKRRFLVLLPGPPKELTALYTDQVEQRLRAVVPQVHIAIASLRMAVVPESEVDARTAPIYQQYPDVQTTILSTQGEIQLHFQCSKPTLAEAEARVREVQSRCAQEMGDVVFSENDESPEEVVLHTLAERGLTLAVAESCTGGLLGQRLTSVTGSSGSFLGGAIVYANAMKTALADVPAETIHEHGAVSEEVARALAEGIRRRTTAAYGIGITGIAGPGGATETKPVGLVYVALADAERTECLTLNLSGDRERVRWFASQYALMLLRKHLL